MTGATIRIRSAAAEDVARIRTLWNQIIRQTTVTFTTECKSDGGIAELMDCWPWLVAESDGTFAGFATYGPFRGGPGYAATAELTIMLTDAARRAGIGATLLDALEARAWAQGIDMMIAGISSENAGAIRFHRRQGYVEAGRLAGVGRKFGRALDLVLMQKRLPGSAKPPTQT